MVGATSTEYAIGLDAKGTPVRAKTTWRLFLWLSTLAAQQEGPPLRLSKAVLKAFKEHEGGKARIVFKFEEA